MLSVAVVACAEGDVTGVRATDEAAADGVLVVAQTTRLPAVTAEAAARIGSKGGTLEVVGARLVVPPGALSRPVLLEMKVVEPGAVLLGPTGVTFATPAELTYTTVTGATVVVELDGIGAEVSTQGFILVGG